jgi:hypothetical protein
MQRWINPPKYGWYSGGHHVHAAGCSHYQNPTEGVRPEDMVLQIEGEKLNVGAVLTWGPCCYSHFSDALPKLQSLAKYADRHSGVYCRIEAVVKSDDTLRV